MNVAIRHLSATWTGPDSIHTLSVNRYSPWSDNKLSYPWNLYGTHPCRVWRNPVVVRSIELFFSKMLNIRDLNLGITVNCVRSGIGGSAHDLVEKRENRHLSVAAAPPVAAFQFCNLSRSHAPRCGRRRRCN